MDELLLNQDITQILVNSTMTGYTNYVKRRKQDVSELIISRAGTWMKGNYIDDAVAKESEQYGVKHQTKMAGYSWEYLQFDYYDKHTDSINSIIFKNYKTLVNGIHSKNNKLPDYLARDSIGNIDILRKHQNDIQPTNKAIQLELLPPTFNSLSDKEDKILSNNEQHRFYVIGYNLGKDGNIEFLKLLMPNPVTNALVEVEDWTKYIVDAPVQPNPDDLIVLQNEKEVPEGQYDDTSNMNYEVADNSEKKDKQ